MKFSDETREKMRHSHLGKYLSEETKKKISQTMTGRTYEEIHGIEKAEEIKRKMSLANKGQIPWMKGKHHTEEWKRTISEKRKGVKHSEEWKKKISEGLKGHKQSEETIQKIRLTKLGKPSPKKGIIFEKQRVLLNLTRCDIFIAPKLVIYFDSCWWHHCEEHDPPTTAEDNWIIRKGAFVTRKLKENGYTVLRFWGHEINNDLDNVLDRIIKSLPEQEMLS
jgi:DNA mismatch endonuclease (patch repair protein)